MGPGGDNFSGFIFSFQSERASLILAEIENHSELDTFMCKYITLSLISLKLDEKGRGWAAPLSIITKPLYL